MGVDYSTVSQGRKRLRETLKRGDLAGFRVYKFKFHHQQYLLAYEIQGNDIVIYMIGTHEIFQKQENMSDIICQVEGFWQSSQM